MAEVLYCILNLIDLMKDRVLCDKDLGACIVLCKDSIFGVSIKGGSVMERDLLLLNMPRRDIDRVRNGFVVYFTQEELDSVPIGHGLFLKGINNENLASDGLTWTLFRPGKYRNKRVDVTPRTIDEIQEILKKEASRYER